MAEGNPLISLLDECVVRIDRGGEFSGTGFFVAQGEILTCAHVVDGGKPITVSRGGWTSPAEIVASAPQLEGDSPLEGFAFPDIALLRVGEPPDGHQSVRLGVEVPAAGDEADRLRLSAFSRGMHRPGVVESHGTRVEFEGVFGDLGVFKLRDGQVVPGFSGSPLLNMRTGLVCGVIESTREEHDPRAFAVPMSVVVDEFQGLIERSEAAHTNGTWDDAVEGERAAAATRRGEARKLPILPPPYELDPKAEYAPSELLKPRYSAVELIEREELQAQFMHWRESPKRLDVLLVTGSGGSGKTRLALEECGRAERAGWTAGLLTLDAVTDVGAKLERLVEWPGRLLVAIDYAETRPEAVGSLIGQLAYRASGAAVRLVLVCRQAGTRRELEELFASGDDREAIAAVLRQAEEVGLGDPEHRLDSRRLFEAGVVAFRAQLGTEAAAVPRVSLEQAHFDRPLFVLAAALLCAEDPTIDIDTLGRDEVMLELIDRHEAQYWQRWDRSLGTELDRSLHAPAAAVATMLGADTEEEALSLVGAIPHLEEAVPERKLEVARWLSHLYASGQLDRAPAISPVEPDMLGEALVGRECTKRPELIEAALDTASEAQLARALNTLARACTGSDPLAEQVGRALGERLPGLVRQAIHSTSEPELAASVELAVLASRPRAKVVEAARRAGEAGPAMAGLAAALYRVAIETLRREVEKPASPSEFAGLLAGFSIALAHSNRGEEAVEAGEEAVEIRKVLAMGDELAIGDELEHQHALANSRNNLAGLFNDMWRSEEAVEAVEAAVEGYRSLVAHDRDRYLPSLSGGLVTLSNVLGNLGRGEEALEAIEEAVEGYREFADDDPERWLPELAGSLRNLAGVLPPRRWREEALPLVREAVDWCRELFELDPKRHAAELSIALNDLSNVIGILGDETEALEAIEEAVKLQRGLLDEAGEHYLPALAASLNNLATLLGRNRRMEEALRVIEEALECFGSLAADDPERWLSELAMSLENLSTILRNLNRSEEALEAIEEALEENRQQDAVGFILLSRAQWHSDEGDLAGAVADGVLALDGARGVRGDELSSDARAFLGRLRSSDEAAFDSIWERDIGRKLPDWLASPAAGDEGWTILYKRAEEESAQPERNPLMEWIALGGEESFDYLEENSDELLAPHVVSALHEAALLAPELPALLARVALLDLARMYGSARAIAEVEGVEPFAADSECLEAAEDPRTLAIARLCSGSYSDDPDIQFHHALAAAAAGQTQEADQAIERCRRLLPSGKRYEYLARIDGLLASGDARSAPLERLRTAFLEAPSEDAAD
ncbi:MAG TPA: trypsin-like peptidase domain-containing protein [Solirubrobacterales bacterium]